MKRSLTSTLLAAGLAAFPLSSPGGTITFAEFDGLGDNAAIPSDPQGLPDGITAVWTGFLLHTTAGDTPMSVFPTDDLPGQDDATITFSAPVVVSSINVYDTDWGTDPVSIVGRLAGVEVWRYDSPGDHPWEKITNGAGKAIDMLAFEGHWNHYDDIVVDAVPMTDSDSDGLPDFWENQFFPGDLTKLAYTGDFDGDGLPDGDEYLRSTDPTKKDTDGDGLSDLVENDWGFYADPTNTGTSPIKVDTDGDGRPDGEEVNGTPQTDPTNPDSDSDGFTDGEEVASGHNPNDPSDSPETTAIADSLTQFSGFQGQDNWYWGYRNFSADGGGLSYDPDAAFVQFNGGDGQGDWDGGAQQWTGSQWDLSTTGAPWSELGRDNTHPNTSGGPVHWTIRRWVADGLTQVTPLALRWHTHKSNTGCGNGVTAALYINGQLKDSVIVAAADGTGVTHIYYANVAPGDKVDLTLSPRGADGLDNDGCDGSINRLLVDPTIPDNPIQPDGSVFIPVGAGDSDSDGLPDPWEKSYFPGDLTKLSGTGDFDNDGLNDLGEYQRGSDPTKADTDGDGLSDLVETGTGIFVSKTNTGSNPARVDSDGDGLNDDVEVNRTPATNPNKSDTDGDGSSDPDEIAWGTDPTNPSDYPLAFVIANSQAEFSGVQGSNGWYNGYRIFNPTVGTLNYDPNQDFVPYPGGQDQGVWDGVNQAWTGSSWDLNTAGAASWAFQDAIAIHPNGSNSPPVIDGQADPTIEQWSTRRWVATELSSNTPVTIIWQVRKTDSNGDGVTGLVFVNGQLGDSKAIAGNDTTGEIRRYRTTLKKNDIVDLCLSPEGANGRREDWSDGSQTWFWVDTRFAGPNPTLGYEL